MLLEAALGRDLQASVVPRLAFLIGWRGGRGDWGALDGFLAAGSFALSDGFSSTASSSPGKLILQALTQTS